MIRRTPTSIKLTPEDVLDYDDEKEKLKQQLQIQMQIQQQQQNSGGGLNSSSSYNQNFANGSQDSISHRIQNTKSKDERLGVRSNRIP
ncbi:hypothetical protein WICMUC_005214 [Wickerhamomyces mucosus]|uniref:Anaphase-promoting complex subunit CDC26 n=1 Tax=Wickerhamomyces mucosus TaxID=1378264 RepID=A0A9P8PAQ7_9ASCO|nr:hypothetical protein WICMUC_005214 [Wickerhamomyces mucosus]